MKATFRGSLVVAVVLAVAGVIAPASASALSCGQTISKNVKLKSDLNCPASSSDGLVIGKGGLTVDLNKHTISGGGGGEGYDGIDDTVGKDRLTVKNGTIKNFKNAINLDRVAKPRVRDLKIRLDGTRSYYGIYAYRSTGGIYDGNDIRNASYAVYDYYGGGGKITNNLFDKPYYGVYSYYSSGDTITGNVSKGVPGTTYGLYLNYSADTTVSKNTLNDGNYGAYLSSMPRSSITRTKANGNGYAGIYLSSNDPQYNQQIRTGDDTTNNNDSYGIYSSYNGGAPGKGNNATGNGDYDCYQARCNG